VEVGASQIIRIELERFGKKPSKSLFDQASDISKKEIRYTGRDIEYLRLARSEQHVGHPCPECSDDM
jgi:hypothetical protein